jgi:hypothetical protein
MQNLDAAEVNSSVAKLAEFSADRFVVERNHDAARQKIEPVATPVAVRKEFLPRRAGESRFAPPQYVYSASPGGAIPSESPKGTPTPQAA